jgi:hypothetical protein
MADQPTTPSGSRWEPNPDEMPTTESPTAATDERPAAAAEGLVDVPPVPPLDDPAAEERRSRQRTRAIFAGAATALALGGGLVGFVIGHSTAGNDRTDFRPANFTGQQPGQLGDGQQFGGQQGQQGFQDPDGDGNGPQGPGNGGSGSNSSSTGGSRT